MYLSESVKTRTNGHKITFNQSTRVGFPFMIASVAVGSVALLADLLIRPNLGV